MQNYAEFAKFAKNVMHLMQELNKKFYKIGEVAELLDIPASTLRFWEDKFTVISPRRNSRGTRFYTPEDVDKISMIHYLVKQRGLKLDAAQTYLKNNPRGVDKKFAAVSRLRQMRGRIELMLKALNSLR